jgi:hypothetical protein
MLKKTILFLVRCLCFCAVVCSLWSVIHACSTFRTVSYASPGPVYVSYIDNQTQEFGNLTTPLHLAVKQRLNKVGIKVVDEKKDAFALNIKIAPKFSNPESFGKVLLMCEVSFQDKQGRIIDGPELIELEPLYSAETTRTTMELTARREDFVDKIAKLIVKRFFRQGDEPLMLRVVE